MSAESLTKPRASITLPDIPAIAVHGCEAHILTTEGEIQALPIDQIAALLHKQSALMCHAPYMRARLNLSECFTFDVLELFAFVHPAKFCTPTIKGLCRVLELSPPHIDEDAPLSLIEITRTLLSDLQDDAFGEKADPVKIAEVMGQNGKGWGWTPYVLAALGQEYNPEIIINSRTGLNIWKHLPECAEEAPEPPHSHYGVSAEEAQERLAALLDHSTEERKMQQDYTAKTAQSFAPVDEDAQPHVLLAEAGTGIGKTLGYLAPASVWAEKNKATVWISTYTKALQRQIDRELNRLYPTPELKNVHVAIRKGRENYMCLLNLEDAAIGAALAKYPDQAIATGIMVRWAAASKNGDLSGGDFPGWLPGVLGYRHTSGLSDKRGECLYAACDHYHKCFVERSMRKSRHARIVIANHALVMINSALSSPGEDMPGRYIFDEGHHLFNAADSAYAAHLSARETRDLRRWILGAEGGKRSRARGLVRRAEDLVAGDHGAEKVLQDITHHAESLTAESWIRRLKDANPRGPTESFLLEIYGQVMARAQGVDTPYSIETHTQPATPELLNKAKALKSALLKIQKPMKELSRIFRKKLGDDEGHMDSDMRKRLDTLSCSLDKRSQMSLQSWIDMLGTLEAPHPQNCGDNQASNFIDWMEIERSDGRAVDIGLYRHWIDPMKPFAASMAPHLHGMAITSATLRDHESDEAASWDTALRRTGAQLLTSAPQMAAFHSPFNYKERTKVFILNDVRKDDLDQVAGATCALFEASNGGGLGIFTAISRMRAVHGRIQKQLENKGLSLYAQHIDEIDPGTLVDMFRDDTHACLLGTDAVRDGVDVPGESLRLIIFDRTPWPRPTILHKARREEFGGRSYDEMLTRLKLKQAFGRLIRCESDKGVFVMLDSMLPSKLHNAFPPDTEIIRCGLGEAVKTIRCFLGTK